MRRWYTAMLPTNEWALLWIDRELTRRERLSRFLHDAIRRHWTDPRIAHFWANAIDLDADTITVSWNDHGIMSIKEVDDGPANTDT